MFKVFINIVYSFEGVGSTIISKISFGNKKDVRALIALPSKTYLSIIYSVQIFLNYRLQAFGGGRWLILRCFYLFLNIN